MSGDAPKITFVGHATVRVDMAGASVLTDPVLKNRVAHLRRRSQPVSAAATAGLDAVLISHLHYDHLDMASLKSLASGVEMIVPDGAGKVLRAAGLTGVTELKAGASHQVGDMEIAAVTAEHDGHRRPRGPVAETVGFVLGGPKRVYFAGDTDIYPEMPEAIGEVDLALLPVWGWGPTLGKGHMDPKTAARAAGLIKPRMAIPIHWGTLFPMGMKRWQERFLTRPPEQFRTEAGRLAPGVDVRILQPGESLELA